MGKLDCGNCGTAFGARDLDEHGDDLYWEDDEYTCEECGATNVISADGETAYVAIWRCRHGVDSDTQCVYCDSGIDEEWAES